MTKQRRQGGSRTVSRPEIPLVWETWISSHELALVCALIFIAGLRIFIFSAAFPPINNVDEQAHLDLVWKYKYGQIPTKIGLYNRSAAEQIVLYASPEYIPREPFEEEMRNGKLRPPLYRHPDVRNPEVVRQLVDAFIYPRSDPSNPDSPIFEYTNHEDTQPPFYYFFASLWLRLGQFFGIQGGFLFYWIRFFNVPLLMATVWLAHIFARRFFGDAPLIRIGTPLITAFFPQDIFFSISNDVPSPLLLGASLYLGLDIYYSKSPEYVRCIGAGLLASAAFLTKQNNFPGLVILLVLGILKIGALAKEGRLGAESGKLVALCASGFLPAAGWVLRNKVILGDWMGTTGKVAALGWTSKSFAEIWQHPIFGLEGLMHFIRRTTARFWGGEFVWGPDWKTGASALIFPPADKFYLITSLLFVAVATVMLMRRDWSRSETERVVNGMNLAAFGMMFLLLAWVSVYFDFNNCLYPSREEPYLAAGRLLIGALIPFVLLYLSGLRTVLPGEKLHAFRAGFVLALVLIMIGAQVYISLPVFSSQYNWFHMFD